MNNILISSCSIELASEKLRHLSQFFLNTKLIYTIKKNYMNFFMTWTHKLQQKK